MENCCYVYDGLCCSQNWNGKSCDSFFRVGFNHFFCRQFDAKGVINAEVAKRVISENFAKQQWEQNVSDDLVEKCAKEVKDSTSSPIDSFGFQCSSKAAEFAYCMWRELFLTCPADKQQTSKQCEKLRNVLMKHDENKFSN